MRIALIGGAGYIGSAIAQRLKEAQLDHCILDTSERLANNKKGLMGMQTMPLEFPDTINAAKRLTGFDIAVHLAWATEPASSMDSIFYDANSNIAPSVALIEASLEAGLHRFIFSSSGGTVYGKPEYLPVKEFHAKEPISAYGISKLSVEYYLALFAKTYNIKGISLRIGNPYGPYQLRGTSVGLIARYLNLLYKNQGLEVWGDGSIIRDYLYIDDLAKAFVSAILEPDLPSGPYNIGSGIGKSVNEIIDTIFHITGKSVPVSYKPGRVFDVPAIILDSTSFRSQTNWFAKTEINEGIQMLWDTMNK